MSNFRRMLMSKVEEEETWDYLIDVPSTSQKDDTLTDLPTMSANKTLKFECDLLIESEQYETITIGFYNFAKSGAWISTSLGSSAQNSVSTNQLYHVVSTTFSFNSNQQKVNIRHSGAIGTIKIRNWEVIEV